MNTKCRNALAGAMGLAGALAAIQAGFANDIDKPLMIAQARGTAGAAGAGAGAAAGAPAGGANAATPPASAGTAGAAGTGAGSAASPGPATGRTNAGVPAGVPQSNRPGTGANNSGVTVRDPAATTPQPADTVPPVGTTTAAPPATVPPGNGVTVNDPLAPNMPSRLEDPARAGSVPADRQRLRDAGRPNTNPGSTAGSNASSDQEFAAALRSCEGLPGGERSACQTEARRIHGRM